MDPDKRVAEIREHFGGLIDEDTAVLLAEYSLGIKDNRNPENRSSMIPISGMVMSKRAMMEKRYCRIEVKTDSETIPVYFWDEAYGIAVNDIFPGMRVEVLCRKGSNGYHVNSGDFISFEIAESELKTVSEIEKGQGISLRGFVAGIEGMRETKDGRKMAVIMITDGSSFASLVLWDDKVEYFDILSPGDEVIVLNAYVNEYGKRLSIHAGRNSYVDVRKLRV